MSLTVTLALPGSTMRRLTGDETVSRQLLDHGSTWPTRTEKRTGPRIVMHLVR
jgi:hypothetical protein